MNNNDDEALKSAHTGIRMFARCFANELLYTGQSIGSFQSRNNIPALIADSIKDCLDDLIDRTDVGLLRSRMINSATRKKVAGMNDLETKTFLKSLHTWDRVGEPLMMSASVKECEVALDACGPFFSEVAEVVHLRDMKLATEAYGKKWKEVRNEEAVDSTHKVETWKTDELKVVGMILDPLMSFFDTPLILADFFEDIRRPGKTVSVALYLGYDGERGEAVMQVLETVLEVNGMNFAYRDNGGSIESDAGVEQDLQDFSGLDFVLCPMGSADFEFLSHADIVIVNTKDSYGTGPIVIFPKDIGCGIEYDVDFTKHLPAGPKLTALNNEISRRNSYRKMVAE